MLDEIIAALKSLSEQWWDYNIGEITSARADALERLRAAGLIEVKTSFTLKSHGSPELLRASNVITTGVYNPSHFRQLYAYFPASWITAEGGNPHLSFTPSSSRSCRLTADGVYHQRFMIPDFDPSRAEIWNLCLSSEQEYLELRRACANVVIDPDCIEVQGESAKLPTDPAQTSSFSREDIVDVNSEAESISAATGTHARRSRSEDKAIILRRILLSDHFVDGRLTIREPFSISAVQLRIQNGAAARPRGWSTAEVSKLFKAVFGQDGYSRYTHLLTNDPAGLRRLLDDERGGRERLDGNSSVDNSGDW